MFDLSKHTPAARLQRACAAALVAGSALLPGGTNGASVESRVHEQVNQLLRVFSRLSRAKASDRELHRAERLRQAEVRCHGRQPSRWCVAAPAVLMARTARAARSTLA